MKSFAKLPFVMGVTVLVASVLFSAIKVGQEQALVVGRSKAANTGAVLSLTYSDPSWINVILNSSREVSGIDAVIKFDKEKITILPSTLKGSSNFVTSGGTVDSSVGTFSFSAIAKDPDQKDNIIASFQLSILPEGKGETNLYFDEENDRTLVLDANSKLNILSSSSGVKLKLDSQ